VNKENLQGFTLIELSIVLVIIGLIVGGVLVGQDLIRAAGVRAQITQIEKYNTAVNTFRGKFGAIPGDMNIATADQFGFTIGTNCGGTAGERDGNGLVEWWNGLGHTGQFSNEPGLFWQDLTTTGLTNLIDGSFPNSGATIVCGAGAIIPALTGSLIGEYVPAGKIGHGTYVLVYAYAGANYFVLQGVTSVATSSGITAATTPITVQEAYKIDAKVDDGLPTSGNVQDWYLVAGSAFVLAPNAAAATSSTCYDTTTNNYSLTINGGVGANCALAFMFQ
jgi:prepilin-type N-terminal cleavage/methylation domain-containing protein